MFQKILTKKEITKKDKIILTFIFGFMGILGTYTGVEINGAIVNARVIGVFVGGLIGGRIVGISSGFLAGIHRYIIDPTGFSSLACAISTIFSGFFSAYLKKYFDKSNKKVLFALLSGMLTEIIQMMIILLVASPYEEAVNLVRIIGLPMIIANGLGIAAFLFIIEKFIEEIEREAAYQANSALKIANETINYFRQGYNREIAEKVARIIKAELNIDGVSLTDTEKILAHVGIGDDHHKYGEPLQTQITKDVIERGNYKLSNTKEEIDCAHKDCLLKSAIIVPIVIGDNVIGTLKLYKVRENAITEIEKEIAIGLANIFSTQIAVSKVEIQKELLTKSELKMLQAQINPHFLFNAINTISSLIRVDQDKARNLLIHLGHYFRNNLNSKYDDITIQEEINNINSYMEIEKARFGEKLNIIYDIPEDLECELPPLIIQPIAENAVKHGVLNNLNGGNVKISARSINNENMTEITVSDDGIGISEKKLKEILSNDNSRDSIGIINVNNRLINKYGEKYGLIIDSKVNQGTNVTFNIPKMS